MIDTADLQREIQKNLAFLAKRGEVPATRPYAILGRCFQALGQHDDAMRFFRIAASKALAKANKDPREYADAAIFSQFAGDETGYHTHLAQAAQALAASDQLVHLPVLISVCFLGEDYGGVIQRTTQLAARMPELAEPPMAVYYEYQFAQAYLSQDRAGMQRAVDGLEEKLALDQSRIDDTVGLSLFELIGHARTVLTRWDAAHT
jgi:hypothetical protein